MDHHICLKETTAPKWNNSPGQNRGSLTPQEHWETRKHRYKIKEDKLNGGSNHNINKKQSKSIRIKDNGKD